VLVHDDYRYSSDILSGIDSRSGGPLVERPRPPMPDVPMPWVDNNNDLVVHEGHSFGIWNSIMQHSVVILTTVALETLVFYFFLQ